MKLRSLVGFLALGTIFLIFCSYFGVGVVSSGDAPFYFPERLKESSFLPQIWDLDFSFSYNPRLFSFFYHLLIPKFLVHFSLTWPLVERVAWYLPFLFLTGFSSFHAFRVLFPKNPFAWISLLVYLSNSYILMIIGGGQISIALAYALAPLVFTFLIKSNLNIRSVILTGLLLSIQVGFEPRIAFLTFLITVFYFLINFSLSEIIGSIQKFTFVSLLAALFHLYWILPVFLFRKPIYHGSLIASDWLAFLSLANFSDSLSLLHPNWPENIFGKTDFFNPLFLILPLMAFSSLLFINFKRKNKEARKVLSFVFIGLLGAFLAKGINPPFGRAYRFLYDNIPFFNTFRDPVKFYFFIALSYMFLIPFSLEKTHLFLRTVSKKVTICFLIGLLGVFLILIKPAWTGKLGGTFKTREIPSEYLSLKGFLSRQDDFSRALWLPKRQRFGFYSNNHPAIDSENFFGPNYFLTDIRGSKELIGENWGTECFANDRCYVKELAFLLDPRTEGLLRNSGVKYLIVPSDSEGEIFIAEYKYNPQQRREVEQFLDQVEWLKKIEVADQIAVYQVSEIKNRFFVEKKEEISIDWQMVNPTKYKVKINVVNEPFLLVFSEKFDPLWQAKIGGQTIDSREYRGLLNSFAIDRQGDLNLTVEFSPQKYVYWGGAVSLLTLFASLICLFYGFFVKERNSPYNKF